MQIGVLSSDQQEELGRSGKLYLPAGTSFDPSSFDLTISGDGYEAEFAFRLSKKQPIAAILEGLKKLEPEGDAFILRKRRAYLIKLREALALPRWVSGRATGRSSLGRIDVMTRLLTDEPDEYDIVRAEYSGPLYVLVLPQSFDIQARVGSSLNQLRLFNGPQYRSVLTRRDIRYLDHDLWYTKRGATYERPNYDELEADLTADPGIFDLTVELGDEGFIYKAKCGSELVLDIEAGDDQYPASGCWEKVVTSSSEPRYVELQPGSFYLMKSKERLNLPREICVDVLAISETLGDIRIHYAGFAHPCFGSNRSDRKSGTPLIFEVRSNDMSTRLYDGTALAKAVFLRMSAPPAKSKPCGYNEQELGLAKWFDPCR